MTLNLAALELRAVLSHEEGCRLGSVPVLIARGAVQAVHAVADALQRHKVTALVVDPVLVATSGDSLAESDVAQAIVDRSHLPLDQLACSCILANEWSAVAN